MPFQWRKVAHNNLARWLKLSQQWWDELMLADACSERASCHFVQFPPRKCHLSLDMRKDHTDSDWDPTPEWKSCPFKNVKNTKEQERLGSSSSLRETAETHRLHGTELSWMGSWTAEETETLLGQLAITGSSSCYWSCNFSLTVKLFQNELLVRGTCIFLEALRKQRVSNWLRFNWCCTPALKEQTAAWMFSTGDSRQHEVTSPQWYKESEHFRFCHEWWTAPEIALLHKQLETNWYV